MKRCTSLLAALLVLVGLSSAQAQLYWDRSPGVDGGGPGGLGNDGIWDTVALNWNTDAGGAAASPNVAFTNGMQAVFSAGTNVAGDPIVDSVVTLSGALTPSSILIDEGHIWWTGSGSVAAAGGITLDPGTRLSIDSSLRVINTTPKISLGNGAALFSVNPGNAGSLVPNAVQIEIDGNGVGFIGYHDQNTTVDNQVSVYQGAILGTGGTVDNGGRGTLIKVGPDQIGIGNIDNYLGSGQRSQALMTFAKLEVREGAYRLRNQTSAGANVDERAFGAVPLAVLPDAITLDGGGIGSNTTVTLHANRGITVTANGGYLDHGAGAGLSIPGPITGAGTLTVGSPTSTSTGNPGFTISNTGNATTFTGKLRVLRGTLTVPDAAALGAAPGSPEADSITIGGTSAATGGTSRLQFNGSTTLNANRGITLDGVTDGQINIPSGGNTLTYNGVISGSGKLVKMGDGTLTSSGTHTHAGGTDIFGRFNVNGGLSGAGAVNVKTAGALGTNGTLAGTGTVAGAVTVESGAHIAPGSSGIGTLALSGGLTLNTGSILDFELGAPGTSDLINLGASALSVGGIGTVALTNAGGMGAGTYTLIDYGTVGGAGLAAFLGQTPTGPAGFTYSLVDTGSLINLNVAAVATNDADFNNDGTIDAADWVAWRKFNPMASGATQTTGDANGDGDNDAADEALWTTTFGQASPGAGGGGAVPEPSTVAMLMIGLAAFAARRRG
jgi:MprA protease rhombosortase-interaction domain-containing protein